MSYLEPKHILSAYQYSLKNPQFPFIKGVSNKGYTKTEYTKIQVLYETDGNYVYKPIILKLSSHTITYMYKQNHKVKQPYFAFRISKNSEKELDKVIILLDEYIMDKIEELFRFNGSKVKENSNRTKHSFLQKITNTGVDLDDYILRVKLAYAMTDDKIVPDPTSLPTMRNPIINGSKTVKKGNNIIQAHFTEEELMYQNINTTIPPGSKVIMLCAFDTICFSASGYSIQTSPIDVLVNPISTNSIIASLLTEEESEESGIINENDELAQMNLSTYEAI